jgi:hypothetical protein
VEVVFWAGVQIQYSGQVMVHQMGWRAKIMAVAVVARQGFPPRQAQQAAQAHRVSLSSKNFINQEV